MGGYNPSEQTKSSSPFCGRGHWDLCWPDKEGRLDASIYLYNEPKTHIEANAALLSYLHSGGAISNGK